MPRLICCMDGIDQRFLKSEPNRRPPLGENNMDRVPLPPTTALLLLCLCLTQPLAAATEPQGEVEPNASNDGERTGDTSRPPHHPSTAPPGKAQIKPLIRTTAKRHGVELALVDAVVAAESAYDAHAVSRAGAIGLMQLMPRTAADYGVSDARMLFDAEVNLETGVRHLKRLLGKYKNDYGRVIMAYNAGEGTVDRTNSNVTYDETLAYTEAVIRHYRRNGGAQPTDDALKKVRLLRGLKGTSRATRLIAQYLDLDIPVLRTHSGRSIRLIDPGLNAAGAKRRPMILID